MIPEFEGSRARLVLVWVRVLLIRHIKMHQDVDSMCEVGNKKSSGLT